MLTQRTNKVIYCLIGILILLCVIVGFYGGGNEG